MTRFSRPSLGVPAWACPLAGRPLNRTEAVYGPRETQIGEQPSSSPYPSIMLIAQPLIYQRDGHPKRVILSALSNRHDNAHWSWICYCDRSRRTRHPRRGYRYNVRSCPLRRWLRIRRTAYHPAAGHQQVRQGDCKQQRQYGNQALPAECKRHARQSRAKDHCPAAIPRNRRGMVGRVHIRGNGHGGSPGATRD